MASTGLILRRNTKANLINNPPLVGEIVFAYDTNELGMIIDGNLVWRDYSDLITSVNGKIGEVVLDKTDIGLPNVDNTADIDKPVSKATQVAIDSASLSATKGSTAALQKHIDDHLNPHKVNKKQLQLDNVDNVSDINKPLSNDMIQALSGKLNIAGTSVDSNKLGGHLPDYFAIKSNVYSKNEIDSTVSTLSTIAYVDNSVSTKADKSYVDSQDNNLQSLISANSTTISTNTDDIKTNNKSIVKLNNGKADISYVDSKDSNIQSQITSNDTDISNIKNNYATKTYVQNEVQTATGDKVSKNYVDNADNNLQTQISTNTTDISNLSLSKADKTYVDSQDTNLQNQINTNVSNIGVNASDISKLKTIKADKTYVDSLVSGLDFKDSVKVSSTSNITLSGIQTIDGITSSAGDRVLVKDQTDATQNGIYVVSSDSWVRSTDADNTPSNEVSGGMFCFVESGTTNGGTGWVLRSPTGNVTLGTDDLIFSKFTDTVLNADEVLTKLKTVDGSGSGLDADLLDGHDSSYYEDASNLNTGTINDARLPDTISSNITGNAATASKLKTARTITLNGDQTGSVSFDGSGNVTLTTSNVPANLLDDLKTVDGSGSGLDADLLDGHDSSYYEDASNLNAGIINDARLPDTISSNITGNAATSTLSSTIHINTSNSSSSYGMVWHSGNTLYANSGVSIQPSTNNITISGDLTIGGGDILINNANKGVKFQNSSMWLSTGVNYDWGLYWNDTAKSIEFKANGSSKQIIDIDNNTITADTFIGNFQGNSLTSGNADTATKLKTPRLIALSGDVSGSVNFDGSSDVDIITIVANNSHTHDQSTVSNSADSDKLNGLVNSSEESTNTIVQRDSSGYIYSKYYNSSGTFSKTGITSGMGLFTGTSGLDTFGRSYTAAAARTLLNVENGATADQTASEILAAIKTVDGSGSGLDADLLDGQSSAFYRNASNLNVGTINDARLPSVISSNITGNAATASKLKTARTITLNGDQTGSVSFDGSNNVTLTTSNVPANLLSDLKTVDGSGSGLDADLLDGHDSSYYEDASNLNAGTINDARLPDTISSSITGNASTASKLKTARTITLNGDQTGSVSFDGSGNVTLTTSNVPANLLDDLKTVDGSGSGLDADLLDGHDSSYFLTTTGKAVDSDKLDGIDSTRVVYGDNTTATIDTSDFNAITKSGFYNGSNATGSAWGTDWNWLLHHEHSGNNGYGFQISVHNGSTAQAKIRTQSSNSWGNWRELAFTDSNVASASKWATGRKITLSGDQTGSVTIDGTSDVTLTTSNVPANLLDDLKTVDGSGSGLDADLLDGHDSTFFAKASGDSTIDFNSKNMIVAGDLTVKGTTTTIDSATLAVSDKNIELGKVTTPTDTTADGGGITLLGSTNKTINWVKATDTWNFSSGINTAKNVISTGYSNSWGNTKGVSTWGFNTKMGTSTSATWLLSGTSGGVFRYGIQGLDGGGVLRIYSGTSFIQIQGSTITGGLSGNASTASKWATGRKITLSGDQTGSVTIDGSGNVTLTTSNVPANLLDDLKTVDGSGSGLDADLLDGHEGTYYLSKLNVKAHADQPSGSTRLPDIFTVQAAYGDKNNPATYGNILNIGGTGQGQVFIGWSSTSGANADNYIRSKRDASDANWSSWAKIWTNVNDGSGSGLDADLLDGINSNQFIRSDVIGTDVTGTLNMKADNQVKLELYNTKNNPHSEIHFKSYGNSGSDYGYIRYDDDNNTYNKWGDSAENSALVLGVENDGQNKNSDIVAIESPAGIFLNAPDVYVGDKSTLHNITADKFIGTSTSAQYADLAEIYTCEKFLSPGTIVTIPKDESFEVQKATSNDIPFGVVSDKPGYLLNSESKGLPIALVGKTPVLVKGVIEKGDIVIFDKDGYCVKGILKDYGIIGRALETNTNNSIKLVKCAVRFL